MPGNTETAGAVDPEHGVCVPVVPVGEDEPAVDVLVVGQKRIAVDKRDVVSFVWNLRVGEDVALLDGVRARTSSRVKDLGDVDATLEVRKRWCRWG